MKLRNLSLTTKAFLIMLLVPLSIGTSDFLCNVVFSLLPPNDIIEDIFTIPLVWLFLFVWIPLPIVATVANAFSVRYQILAIKNGESKAKNIIIFIYVILVEIFALVRWNVFWYRGMGV